MKKIGILEKIQGVGTGKKVLIAFIISVVVSYVNISRLSYVDITFILLITFGIAHKLVYCFFFCFDLEDDRVISLPRSIKIKNLDICKYKYEEECDYDISSPTFFSGCLFFAMQTCMYGFLVGTLSKYIFMFVSIFIFPAFAVIVNWIFFNKSTYYNFKMFVWIFALVFLLCFPLFYICG